MEIQAKFNRETEQQSSAQRVAAVNDLLTLIFLRLPLESLQRFKVVSKAWLSLISDIYVCCRRTINPAVGMFLPLPSAGSWDELRYEYVPFTAEKQWQVKPKFNWDRSLDLTILQSCNGLMLCFNELSVDPKYSVYNPTTRGISMLPQTEEIDGIPKKICGMNLAFDPVKSSQYYVVSVLLLDGDLGASNPLLQIQIYSSNTRSWIVSGEPFTSSANFEKGVYWNGAINWICTTGDAKSLYFNIEKQRLCEMPQLPLTYSLNCKRVYYFGESGGHLHLIDMRGPQVKFKVYELKSDYSEWFVKYQVDVSSVVVANPTMALFRYGSPMWWGGFSFSISAVVRGDEEEDSFLVLHIAEKAIRYNIVSKSFADLVQIEERIDRRPPKHQNLDGFQYIQSIICV